MCEDEVWKDIDGYPGYQVSSHGRVRSFKWPGVGGGIISGRPQRILNPGHNNGYPQVGLGDGYVCTVHRLVADAFLGPCPQGMEVCHKDGTRINNHISNLRYDTHAANMQERTDRVSDDVIRSIRERAAAGESFSSIARDIGKSDNMVYQACLGKTYKDVGGPIVEKGHTLSLGYGKITYSDADDIRSRHQAGVSQSDLAAEYGVSISYICHIVHLRRLVRPKL